LATLGKTHRERERDKGYRKEEWGGGRVGPIVDEFT